MTRISPPRASISRNTITRLRHPVSTTKSTKLGTGNQLCINQFLKCPRQIFSARTTISPEPVPIVDIAPIEAHTTFYLPRRSRPRLFHQRLLNTRGALDHRWTILGTHLCCSHTPTTSQPHSRKTLPMNLSRRRRALPVRKARMLPHISSRSAAVQMRRKFVSSMRCIVERHFLAQKSVLNWQSS